MAADRRTGDAPNGRRASPNESKPERRSPRGARRSCGSGKTEEHVMSISRLKVITTTLVAAAAAVMLVTPIGAANGGGAAFKVEARGSPRWSKFRRCNGPIHCLLIRRKARHHQRISRRGRLASPPLGPIDSTSPLIGEIVMTVRLQESTMRCGTVSEGRLTFQALRPLRWFHRHRQRRVQVCRTRQDGRHAHAEALSSSQDADGDGIPDAGQTAAFVLPVTTIDTRLPSPR